MHHTVPYVEGTFVPGRQPGDLVPLSGTTVEKVVRTRKGIVVRMEDEKEVAAEFPGLLPDFQAGMRSGLTVPLIAGDRVIGGLALRSIHPGIYTEHDLRLAENVSNQIAGAIANAQLYAERKQMEKILRKSEEKFRVLLDNAAEGIVVVQDERIKYANPRALHLFAATAEQVKAAHYLDFTHPDDRELILERYRRLAAGENVESKLIYRVLDMQGKSIWVEGHVSVMSWEERPATLDFLTDITERKRAENALKESEERFRNLFDSSKDSIFIIDQQTGRFVGSNRAANQLYGYSGEEFMRMNVVDISAEPEKTEDAIRRHVAEIPLRFHRKKDGTVFPVEITGSYFMEGGRILHTAHIRDITERRRAEEVLKSSEEKYRNLVESTWEAILVRHRGIIEYANPAAVELFGASSDAELIGKSNLDLIHPDDRADSMERLKRTEEGFKVPPREHRIVTLDGRVIHVESVGIPFTYRGRVLAYGMFRDITERKEVEKSLRESEEEAKRLAQENAIMAEIGRIHQFHPEH